MKFQCVPCGKSMTLDHTEKRAHGAISLVYACADCGYEMAMMTNPYETQMVASLGVDLGDDAPPPAAAAAPEPGSGSKCPMTGIAQEVGQDGTAAAKVSWTAGAEARLAGAPEFVKPVVCVAVERFARENGYAEVDEKVLDEAKSFLGM